MLETYKGAAQFMWKFIKGLAIALSVMLPGLILIAYMIITKNADISWWVVAADIAIIALWAPIPTYPIYKHERTILETYQQFPQSAWWTVVVCVIITAYFVLICLPVLTGLTISTVLNREPQTWEIIGTLVFNVLWAPGAHYVASKLGDKLPG